mgnify:CR=1 FL=1
MPLTFAVVSYGEAQADPYPYVWVNDDGSYRELETSERRYLEQAFSPFDGARPYVKSGYASRTPGGHLRGYLRRSLLPEGARSIDTKERSE